MFAWVCASAYAQTEPIRYVHPDGSYTNNGQSWATAKNRVQDAINDLYEYMQQNSLTSGSVYIAAGSYLPTESTESSGGSMLNTSFKIFEGIHVYGGFDPDTAYARVHEPTPGDRMMANGKKVSENWADPSGIGTTSGKEIAAQWDLKHKTILTGNHAGSVVTFTFDSIRGRYNTTYPASSYHVVWFATNGKYTTSDDALKDHFKPLAHPASLDGCVISSGNASTRNTNLREHTAFGGGVYLAEGGTVNHCTVTGNCCSGPDVTYYGRRHGRSGGIYVRNCGLIFNSVFWGNRCDANNDIQFASVRQKTGVSAFEIFAYHTAFMNHDITDWTGVKKDKVFSLDRQNMPTEGSSANYPCFFSPTVDPNNWHRFDTVGDNNIHGAGVFMHLKRLVDIPGPRIWHLTSYSALDQKGVQWNESVQGASPWLIHAHTDYGVVTNPYEPVSTLGALVRRSDALKYALIAPQGQEGRKVLSEHPDSVLPTLFVDPNRPGLYDEEDGHFMEPDNEGNSWTTPIKDIGEALSYFRQYLVADEDNRENHHFYLPKLDANGDTVKTDGVPDSVRYEHVQILVKEGTLTTVGPGNYLDGNIRTAAVRIESHMRMYGGYPSSLTGTNTEGRNPRAYKSFITANITGKDIASAYQNNSAHVIAMVNCEHAIVDGFTLSDANTHNVYLSNSAKAGGGVLLNNASVPQAERIHMVGNQVRNCVITNCSSPKGAAIFVNGEWPRYDNSLCYAEMMVMNCIIRNNSADYTVDESHVNDHGIITANGRAYVHVEHCTIVNNVGFPFKADSKSTDDDEQPIACPHPEHSHHSPFHGYIRVDNSLVFCNSDRSVADNTQFGNVANVLSVNADGQEYVFGKYNMFDADLVLHEANEHQPHGFFQDGYDVPITDHFMPDGVGSHYVDDIGDVPEDSLSRANQCIFTRTDMTASTFPVFVNPSRNVGHSETGDKALYGGVVTYVPLTTNPCVNAAGRDEYTDYYDYDRSDVLMRNRGGAPDVGAVENDDLPAAGLVIYVTPEGAGKRDGSSWSNAIAGNAVYRLYGAGPATGDSIDANNGARLVKKSDGSSVLTTDERYCGGFARSYFTSLKTGVTTSTTVTNTWTTEDSVFVGGTRDKEKTRGFDHELVESSATTITNSGTSVSNLYANDTRYPYGELSGGSRSFWRANPYHNGTKWASDYWSGVYGTSSKDNTGVFVEFVDSCSEKGWINNTRRENYVSGLQWAVEEAARRNHVATRLESESFDTIVQVWVGAGKYTDYKGYVMRDSVTVLGGFPAGKYAAPGMNERQALMSNVITIPKSLPAKDYEASDYESILQISDVNPVTPDTTFNSDAVKFADNDLSGTQATDTRSYTYKVKHVVDTFTFQSDTSDITSKYINYPGFESGSTMRQQDSPTDSIQYLYGNQAQLVTKDYWHIVYPNTKTYYQVDIAAQNDISIAIYNYDTPAKKIENKKSRWYRIGNGSLTGLKMFQTMKNVEAGKHLFTLDFMGGYRNTDGSTFDLSTNCGIYLHILDAAGNELITPVLFKCRGTNSVSDNDKDRARKAAFRKTVEFTLPTTQNVKIYIEVLDGTKNTKTADATYGTDDGRDPDYIPWYYVWDKGTEAKPSQNWGTKNPNRREFFITNCKLEKVEDAYVLTDTEITVDKDTVVENPRATETITTGSYEITKTRTPIRKRVLTMPDVCAPTYGGGGIGDPVTMAGAFYGDSLSHTDRSTGAIKDLRTAAINIKREDPHYVAYADANWDGFTIRHGFLYNEAMAHGGGAGVNMYEGGHLRNCIVINNISACQRVKGGGIFCDGATSTVEGCFVLNNTSTRGTEVLQGQIFAGGMFMYEGTCFNSLFANNYSWGSSGGVGFCVGRFFNNTIAYNTCNLQEKYNNVNQYSGGAISLAIGSSPNLFVANTIIFGNNGVAIRDRNAGVSKVNPFLHCYIQSEVANPNETTNRNVENYPTKTNNKQNYGIENIYLNGVALADAKSPFAADYVNGVYTPGNAKATNDYRLLSSHDTTCVNRGTENFAGVFYTALRQKGSADATIRNSFVYKSVAEAELPSYDVAFAKRIQDCQIDIGAYEYNAAYSIKPDTMTHPGRAIFYVSFTAEGDASASSPLDAACKQKMQLVLDAAGRYKHTLMTESRYDTVTTIRAGWPSNKWTVEVWLQGDSVGSMTTDEYEEQYTPTRSTRHSEDTYQDNTLDYSFIVPHGVQVRGGYTKGFYHYEKNGAVVAAGTDGAHIVDERDPLTFRTVLSGTITSSTGATGQTYHVVTFTNDLFSPDDEKIIGYGDQLASMTNEKDRAILDGLFLMDGNANGPDVKDQIGGGCVVTDYAHVRNCVIQSNTAHSMGGGLYLKPHALVSGTIVKYNTANVGGGVYVEAPSEELEEEERNKSLAHVYSTTICENTARSSAGGMFFDNTFARINSSVIWHNNANDNANVSGNFARAADSIPYPLNCCAVESRRLEGQGNIELSPKETEGVRWDRQDPFDAVLYYPIEMSSTLARAGISYAEWDSACAIYTTLDTIDIAGVSRKRWVGTGAPRGYDWKTDTLVTKNNDVIEIGARAINKSFEVHVNSAYVMHRLYVVHSELIDSKAARALQDNPLDNDTANMYRQMGSCIYNPFHRLDDAFSYIIKARTMDKEKYRNTRFEIFVEQGTYYPLHDAYMRQGEVRMNTFLVPEAVLIIGGVDSRPNDHKYGQEGFKSPFSSVHIIGNGEDVPIRGAINPETREPYVIQYELTDSIRLRDARHRPMRDNNLNSVIEPWELERQTILSGNAVAGEDFTHVYHVVTCHADERYIGPRPIKYGSLNPAYNPSDPNTESILTEPLDENEPAAWKEENDLSILARTIGFDGVQITGGYANHVDPSDTADVYNQKTYFRGGGIFVDGGWTENADRSAPNMTEPADYNIPIVVENCYFTNNMAGNGGAIYSNGGIYAYGNCFTQNYSQGPITRLDQQFIPWTAGGCIATNAVCDVSNTLFANNEAKRGFFPLIADAEDEIPDADARQGFGGVLSVAHHAKLRVVNCHFVKNKAVAYPSIYNFLANNRYSDPDSMQYAFNSIFWGNEVFDIDQLSDLPDSVAPPAESEEAFETKYKASRAGVFHYDGTEWDRYEQLYHRYDSVYHYWAAREDTFNTAVIDTLQKLRAQGNKIEGLYFCSYRQGYGPTAMKPTQEGYLLTREEQRAWQDPRGRQVRIKTSDNDDKVEDYTNLWTQVSGNNNAIINRLNTATDGPNFKQPSFVAGIDGYMQNADWLLARMNHTTDQGWGHLKQTVTRGIAYYITKYTGTEQFKTAAEALTAAKAKNDSATEADVYPVSGLPVATFLPEEEQTDTAMYNFLAWRYGQMMSKSNAPLPLGDQYYMTYTHSFSDSEMSGNMDRISKNPKMNIDDVYIDMGIYEYQYVQLDIKGQEIDTVWVATKAKDTDPSKQNGLSWETPTTDLQTAIDLLMSSHNNHDKYVCLMGDEEGGTFSPQNVLDNRRAFIITSNSHAPLMPDSASSDVDYGVNSLTFLGGYSFDVKDAARDPQANPTVIEMPDVGNRNQLNQLFIVEDMTRQMLQVNFQGEYTSRDSVVIPIVFDGITFINPYSVKEPSETAYSNLGGSMTKKGGAAIYYRWQRRYEGVDETSSTPNFNMALHPDSALIDGTKVTLPKLTISNCIFMDNGARTADHAERSPAVRIDHGGGSSLIVNTLFHSNAGAPVYARTYDISEEENDWAMVPNDVVMMNVTSALNDGHIRLESENSEVHNSLIWLDDLHNDTTIQLQLGASDIWDKNTHKNREGIAGRMTHNAVWGCFQNHAADKDPGDTYVNHPLATDNNDIFKGPGFVFPYVGATTSEQRRERSFRLNPTVRTQDMADTTIYRQKVFFRQYPGLDEGSPYWLRSNGYKDLTAVTVANDMDLAAKPRLSGKGMERGAYECLAVLQRVLYVRPELPAVSAGDGSSWERAFGQGQMQNAIDAAAVYTYMNQSDSRDDRISYVFVKGTGASTEPYHLVARDGVYVFGSLPAYFIDTAWVDAEQHKFTNEECHRFTNYVRATTSGVASPNAPQTKINSIHITGDAFRTGFLLDGFVITNPTGTTTTPVIIDNELSAVRNCLVVDNVVDDHPVTEVQKGLLYNCLFYSDSAEAVVKVGANGLVLNNTIIADSEDVSPLDDAEATTGAVQNTISLNAKLSTLNCFAPYVTQNALAYQLYELSDSINTGTMDDELPALFDDYTTNGIVNFKWDRDLLGNPRKISSSVDMGALETWFVAEKQAQEISAITNKVSHLSPSAIDRDTAYTKNYGGHKYPHPGSVVYLMDSSVMSMQYTDGSATDFRNLRNEPIVLSPGFMLLKPAASFYGNGHSAQFNYLAAEKRFVNQRYSMTSFPFDYPKPDIATYTYNGAARSQKDYIFQPRNSELWTPVTADSLRATEGYLMDFGRTVTDTVIRFAAHAPAGQYVYTESGELDKTVYLTQYDHRTAGTGADLNFTRQEDMGWNMKGLPWLVSNYRTDTILNEGNYQRQMFIPHVFYQMDGDGEYLTVRDQIYTSRSWDSGATMAMGNAFLTQTATTETRETVYFHLPYYGKNEKASRPILRVAASGTADYLTVRADSTATKQVSYTYGRDGIKWIANDSTVQIYLLDSKRQSRISFLDAAPTETDIPLGIYVPASLDQEPLTFSLPQKEAFASYGYVWMIDYQTNRYIPLLEQDFEIELAAGVHNDRFALRIGGYPKTDAHGKRQYIVYAHDHTLHVRGLIAGDRIDIYSPVGQKIYSDIVSSPEWTLPLSYQSGYIVTVNNTPHKVINW